SLASRRGDWRGWTGAGAGRDRPRHRAAPARCIAGAPARMEVRLVVPPRPRHRRTRLAGRFAVRPRRPGTRRAVARPRAVTRPGAVARLRAVTSPGADGDQHPAPGGSLATGRDPGPPAGRRRAPVTGRRRAEHGL